MPRPPTPIGHLTDRERDVARLLARGYTNPRIAEELGITFATAKWYVSQVISKLGASSREEAAAIWAHDQRWTDRLRRGLATLTTGSAVRKLALYLGAAVGVGLLVIAVALIRSQDDGEPAAPADSTGTPSPGVTPTVPSVVAGPCDDENLVNGFIVVGQGEPPPDCAGLAGSTPIPPTAPDGKRYELAVPPGPWNQENFEPTALPNGVQLDGVRYFNNETGQLALVLYRHTSRGLPGRVIEGSSPRPVDFLPGPGVVVERIGSTAAYWLEDDQTFGIEVFNAGGSNLTIEQAAGLPVFFAAAASQVLYWDPATRTFVHQSPWLYPDAVNTGFDYIDAIIQSFVVGGNAVAEHHDPIQAPCVANPGVGLILPPGCPDGAPEGTLVDAWISGSCPGQRTAIDSFDLTSGAPQRVWLHAIEEVSDPGDLIGLRYVAAFTSGERVFSVGLTDEGVAGIWGGGSCPTPELAAWARTIDTWLLPPLYPLPD
ncbi:MAG: helix-turn-helix transcriptional regulator [Dehalococcoidia bacterium]|nr:helix-turn-helix transcriptional regulator [Dehalococcoidia bacterium]